MVSVRGAGQIERPSGIASRHLRKRASLIGLQFTDEMPKARIEGWRYPKKQENMKSPERLFHWESIGSRDDI